MNPPPLKQYNSDHTVLKMTYQLTKEETLKIIYMITLVQSQPYKIMKQNLKEKVDSTET